MSALEKYLSAVETRKAIDGRGAINFAIAAQLERKDVPLLIEIIRFLMVPAPDHDAGRWDRNDKLQELAAKGDCSRWGDYPKESS